MVQLTEEYVKSRVIEWLGKQDYIVSQIKTLSEHGVDIKAKKARSNNFYLIECKGEPQTNPVKMRYPTLVSALGEIIQRVKHRGHVKYAIALPETYKELIIRKIPWIACKRISLEMLLVDSDGIVFRINWQDLKKKQKMIEGSLQLTLQLTHVVPNNDRFIQFSEPLVLMQLRFTNAELYAICLVAILVSGLVAISSLSPSINAQQSSSSCGPDPMKDVRKPGRFVILSLCQHAEGKVMKVMKERDGDWHIAVKLNSYTGKSQGHFGTVVNSGDGVFNQGLRMSSDVISGLRPIWLVSYDKD